MQGHWSDFWLRESAFWWKFWWVLVVLLQVLGHSLMKVAARYPGVTARLWSRQEGPHFQNTFPGSRSKQQNSWVSPFCIHIYYYCNLSHSSRILPSARYLVMVDLHLLLTPCSFHPYSWGIHWGMRCRCTRSQSTIPLGGMCTGNSVCCSLNWWDVLLNLRNSLFKFLEVPHNRSLVRRCFIPFQELLIHIYFYLVFIRGNSVNTSCSYLQSTRLTAYKFQKSRLCFSSMWKLYYIWKTHK